MHLLVAADAPIVRRATAAAAAAGKAFPTPVRWDVAASTPLGAEHNLAALRSALHASAGCEHLFASTVGGVPLDPSATPADLGLTDGAAICIAEVPLADAGAFAATADLVPLGGAAQRFASWGDAVDVAAPEQRRAMKRSAGWGSAVAVGGVPLGADGHPLAVTFRVTSEGGAGLGGRRAPCVMVGVTDGNVPLDEHRAHREYPYCWCLDTASGAVYAAAEPRPTFVDAMRAAPAKVRVITVRLDPQASVVHFVEKGDALGTVAVPRHAVDGLYPMCELHSAGAVVELL